MSNGAEIRIETEASLLSTWSGCIRFDPEDAGAVAASALGLLHDDIVAATATDQGALRIDTARGAVLRVAPHQDYEAWGIVWPDGRRVICMPGGDLAIWDLRTPE